MIYRLMAVASAWLLLAVTARAQTCNPHIPVVAADSRYEVLASEAEVRDSRTGLVWQRCSLGQNWSAGRCNGTASALNWQGALQAARAAGNDWRLPDIKELQSLVEDACQSPAINTALFPGTVNDWYWSSSPVVTYPAFAWYVHFGSGNSYGDAKSGERLVRMVRSGP